VGGGGWVGRGRRRLAFEGRVSRMKKNQKNHHSPRTALIPGGGLEQVLIKRPQHWFAV